MDGKSLRTSNTVGNKGGFKKGHVGYKAFLGRKHTPETKKKLSQIAKEQGRSISFKGRSHSEETKRKISETKKAQRLKLTEYQKQKLSEANVGKIISEEHKEKLRAFHTGRKHSKATKEKLRKANLGKKHPEFSGERHPMWKGGVTSIYKKIRKSPEYIAWRESVFKRDNYTCLHCGIKGGVLNADHIKPFATHPKLRLDIDNGRTLCEPCHKKTDTWGGNSKN